jgi:ABC-type transport system substrate-binding protein
MNHKKTIIGTIAIVLILLMTSQVLSAAHHSGLPKVDEIRYKAYPGASPDTVVSEFLAQETEWMGGPGRKDLYDSVDLAGHKISPKDPMSEFGFMPINCRDYKSSSGQPNFPLNDSAFRLAMSYIYGMDDKQTDIFNYLQADWTFALNNCVPPAQEPWYDNAVALPDTNFDQAWTILSANGYVINATDGNALYKNGVKIRDIDVSYSTGTTYWQLGPGGGMVTNLNAFISYIGASSPTFTLVPEDFMTLVMELMLFRDYDCICIGLTNMGIYVDWLYDLLHSDNVGAWGWNFGGIVDTDFDTWTETILTSLSEAAIITAASQVQNKFIYQLMPWFPMDTGSEFCSSWRSGSDELMNILSMPNYGPSNDWSWMAIHWNGTAWPGGTVKRALGDEPHTMNPFTEDTLYGWQMMDRAIPGLLGRKPTDLTLMPFVSTNWTLAQWASIPELGITDGSTATFYLRQDVYWQDGVQVTAEDCVNTMRIMRKYKPGRYSSTWANLVYEEREGKFKFNVYFYTTSLYYAVYVAGTSLLCSKHVMDKVEQWVDEGKLATWEEWDPCFTDYDDATMSLGTVPAGYTFMKQLVGCGPFVFDYYDRGLAIGRVEKYSEFFVSAPVIAGAYGEWRNEPGTAYTYTVLLQNIAAKEDSADGEVTSVTVTAKVYEDDVLEHSIGATVLDPWDWQYFGSYTTASTIDCGIHEIKIEVYDGATLIHTYIHEYITTDKADINEDFFVDGLDIIQAAFAFGSYPGHDRWLPDTDLNGDFKVDGLDLILIAFKFGWTCL